MPAAEVVSALQDANQSWKSSKLEVVLVLGIAAAFFGILGLAYYFHRGSREDIEFEQERKDWAMTKVKLHHHIEL